MIALGLDPAANGLPATSVSAPLEPILKTDTVFALPLAVKTNCPLGSTEMPADSAALENGLPAMAVRFKVDATITYPLSSPVVLTT